MIEERKDKYIEANKKKVALRKRIVYWRKKQKVFADTYLKNNEHKASINDPKGFLPTFLPCEFSQAKPL